MSTIDQRVVEMRFDNKQFESGVATTMSTLEKFKQSLNLTGATKGLENVSSAAKKCDMSALGTAVETVKTKFSALEVMGITALANITNSAVNAGKRMVSALTIDPIKTGFAEYETQINAVQTILANTQSKGTTLNDVNGALDTLNTYADKTIYNFTEMTRNIGTFTAAGVDLDTSVKSIQGIANLAAVSGSTSQQASTAMYQLSQALSSGTVKLMDWNSVVNAGMGGQVFQDALKETARVHGVNIDKMIKKNGSFRETLQEGWLTSEILTETLEKFTMTTEGLTEAEIAKNREMLKSKGYTDEQIEAIFKLGNTATNAATKVKTFSQLWDTLKEAAQSGWTQTWEIIVGDFEEAKELLTEVSNVIGKVIGDSAQARNELLQGWKDAGGRKDLIDGLWNAFEAMGNIIKPIKEAFREIFPPLTVKNLTDFTSGFKDLTARFKEFTGAHGDQIKSIFKGIFSVLDMGLSVIKAAASGIGKLFGFFTGYSGSILDMAADLGDWLTNLRTSAKETDIFNKALEKVKGFLSIAKDGLVEFGKAFIESFKFPGYEGALGFFQTLWEMVCKIGSGAVKVFSALGKGLSEAFSSFDINQLVGAINGGLFTGILLTIKSFTKGIFDSFVGEEGVFENIRGILDDVRGCFQAYQEQLKAGTLLKIASAIGILAASIFVISTIDANSLSASLGAITVLFGELMGSLAIFTQIGGKMGGVVKSIGIMTGMSVAILILSSALKKLSTVDPAGLAKGLVGVGALMAELSIFMRTAKFDGKMVGSATGIVILSAALHILVGAVRKFGEIDPGVLKQGLIGVGAVLTELALFTRLTGNAKHVMATGTSMVLLGAALKILASAVSDFGSMDPAVLGQGLVGLAGALGAVTLAMNFMPKNMIGIGVGLVAVSGAMMILAQAMSSFGSMGWDAIGQGLAAIGGVLLELVVALNLMNGTLSGSAALIVAAGALAIMAPVMQQLGQMTWSEIGMGLVTIAAAFGAVGIAGALLTPVIPSILGLAGAFALFGVATLGIGAGLGLIAAGFSALAVAGATGATAIVAALTIIVTGVANLIPTVCVQIANGIVAFTQALAVGAPVIFEAIGVILDGLLNLIVEYVPKLVVAGMQLLIGLLQGISDNIAKVVETAIDVVLNFIAGIAASIPKIIQSGIDLMLSFINGLANGIRNNTDKVIAATDNLMDAVIGAVKKYFTHFTSKGKDLISKMISGVKSKFSDFKGAAKDMMDGFIKGVKEKFSSIKNTAVDAIKGAVSSVKSFLGIHSPSKLMATLGKFTMMGFSEGIDEDMTAEQAAKKKGQNIVNAFKKELDKIELDKKTLELEYELKTNTGETVDEADKLSKQLDLQSDKVQIANCEYEITMREFGETAEETQEAYNKLLTEKIEMSKLSAKLSEIQAKEFESNKASTEAYIAWMKESAASLSKLGFTSEQINSAAKAATGYSGTYHFDYSKGGKGGWTEEEMEAGFTRVGQSAADGFAAGLESGTSKVAKAAASVGSVATEATKTELAIHSPSRVFAKIGRQSIEGMVAGLTKYAGEVKNAATNIGDVAMSSVSEAISGISNIFGPDLGSQPTIRPVLDLSNIQNGATRINSLLGQPSLALSGIGSTSNMNSILNQMQNRGNSNDDIVTAISDLRGDFGSLASAISKMQIRMDSGTVVGELIGKIDTSLGKIAHHKGRG